MKELFKTFRLAYILHPSRYTRYWAAQISLYGIPALKGNRSKSDIERYQKIRPGVPKGMTRRFVKAWWKKEIIL